MSRKTGSEAEVHAGKVHTCERVQFKQKGALACDVPLFIKDGALDWLWFKFNAAR